MIFFIDELNFFIIWDRLIILHIETQRYEPNFKGLFYCDTELVDSETCPLTFILTGLFHLVRPLQRMNSGQRPPQDVFSWGGAAYLSRWVLADVRADMTMRMLSVSHMITAAAWRCPTANHRLVKIPRWLTASGKHLALSRTLIGAGVPLQVNAVFQPHLIFLCFCPLISELQCFFGRRWSRITGARCRVFGSLAAHKLRFLVLTSRTLDYGGCIRCDITLSEASVLASFSCFLEKFTIFGRVWVIS